ncbi:hypothetical protein BH10BAC1_BH10BAC1_14430 [soil metagenome]
MEILMENKSRITAFALTAIAHIVLFLILFLFVFKTQESLKPFSENSNAKGGLSLALLMENVSFAQSTTASSVTTTTTSITDPNERTLLLNNQSTKEQTIVTNVNEEQSEFQTALQKIHFLKGRKGGSAAIGTDIGDHEGNDNMDKLGEQTNKEDFFLENRQLISKPENILNDTEEGKVVVEIVVDESGKVISALPGQRGSTTTNRVLYDRATKAAYSAKFNPSTKGIKEQRGTYTFVFSLE